MKEDKRYKSRVERELQAHTTDDVLAKSYRLKDRFDHIWHYPSRLRLNAVIDQFLNDVENSKILDYGCGRGESSLRYLERGAYVYGIDISPNYIADAARAIKDAGYRESQYSFQVMDAHELDFDENSFDMVIGEGILHHLDAEVALREIHRVLKPSGSVLMLEPLADNPLLKLFRVMTPSGRTEDERPFQKKDLIRLSHECRWENEMAYCGIIEAPIAMITSVLIPNNLNNIILHTSDRFERWMHEHRLLLSWNQYVLINMEKK